MGLAPPPTTTTKCHVPAPQVATLNAPPNVSPPPKTMPQVWRREGQQHANAYAAWSDADVSFVAVVHAIRFVGVTGADFLSDAAIGYIELIPGLLLLAYR